MERTHRWALRSLAARTNPEQALFAIVQGGVVTGAATRVGRFPHAAPVRRLRHRRPGGGRHARRARGHDALLGRAPARRAPALPDGRGHAARSARGHAGGRRHVRLRAAHAPGLAGHGLHVHGARAHHARCQRAASTSRSTRAAPAPPARTSAARTCTTCSSAASRSARASLRIHNLHHYHSLMAEARAAIEAGTLRRVRARQAGRHRSPRAQRQAHGARRPAGRERVLTCATSTTRW